jgi:RHS repeat-associated protein
VTYSFNGTTTNYVYDGEGKRVMKWDNTGAIVYVYDGLGRLAAEYTTSAPQNNGISYLTSDHLGSTRVVTGKDGGGNAIVKAKYDYLPFGEEVPTGLGGRNYLTDNTRQKFTGHERDPETKLDFAQARYCSSTTGRFMSPDNFLNDTSAVDPASWNLYVYVRNNPLRYVDPSGERIYVGGLSQTEQEELISRINYTYGCQTCVSVGSDGYLQVDTSNLSNAVRSATQYLTDAINATNWYADVQVSNNDPSIAFGQGTKFGKKVGSVPLTIDGRQIRRRSDVTITLDFGDDKWVSGKAKDVFLNLVFAHEVAHFWPTDRFDPKEGETGTGAVVDIVNEIQLGRGLPLRSIYASTAKGGHWFEINYGVADRDREGNIKRNKVGGIQVKVTETDRYAQWIKKNAGGKGIN